MTRVCSMELNLTFRNCSRIEMSNEVSEHIKDLLKSIPNNPGVYQYYDKSGSIIYVGKAKNLKKT